MSLTLSDTELERIADQLFLLKDPPPEPLLKPTNSAGANSLGTKLDPIANDARFKDIGIGVVDFTSSFTNPKVWLHNEDQPWRIGSTGKIAILLAAVQLRDDVRNVKATDLISTAAEFDELFSTIWAKKSNKSTIRQISGKGSSPRISTIFDVEKIPIDFIGSENLDRGTLSSIDHLDWPKVADYTFWERLWLTGTQSDNVAATTCVSEIGVAYMKAVQRAHGLFDPKNGMHLLLGSGYAGVSTKTPVSRAPGAPMYRSFRNQESNRVTDAFKVKTETGEKKSYYSTQPGSAAALTAYITALMQDKLVNKDACVTIRTHLADQNNDTTTSLILQGVEEVSLVNKAHTKLGILGSLRCEFAYLEADGLKYAVVATGILPRKVGGTTFNEEQQGRELGKAVHNALKP